MPNRFAIDQVGAGGGGITNINISAGTTSQNLSNVVFSNSNGVSFGLNGSTITASAGGGGGSINFSAGTTSGNLDSVVFSNSNNVSFGLNGSTVTGTVTVASTQGSINLSAGTTSNLASAFTFSNSNGISFGLDASTITASYTVPVQSNGILDVSTATQSGTATSRFAMHDHQHRGIRGIAAVGTASTFFGDFNLSGGNGVTLITGGNTTAGSVGFSVANQSNQQMTMFATGNTILSSTGTSNASSLIFRGSGAASVGITNGSILIDVAAGAAAITQSIGISTQTAGGATAGTSGYATGDDIRYHFVPGSNITMSQSLNGASATLSIYGPAGGATISSYWNDDFFNNSFGAIGQSTSFGQAFLLPQAGSFSFQRWFVSVSMFSSTLATLASATASAQAGQTTSANLVIYSIGTGASSQSLMSVTSDSTAWNASQRISITNSTQYSQSFGLTGHNWSGSFSISASTARSTSNYSFSTGWASDLSGARVVDTPLAISLTPGNYWLIFGFSSSSSSAGAGLGGMSAGRGPAPFNGIFAKTLTNISFGIMNSTNLTSGGYVQGASFSTAGGGTISAFPVSALSSAVSNLVFNFQLLRSA